MAGPTKRPKKPAQHDSGEEYESDESGSYNGPQEIQATFEGRNPEVQDFHGIKQLLQQLFPTTQIDLSQISDMLISQTGIGSVLKQSCNDSDDDEDIEMVEESDVFGITSVLNLTNHKETPCIQQLYKLFEDEVQQNCNENLQSQIKQILKSTTKIGFIINERFVNIPCKISALMLNSLHDEISRMKKKNVSYNYEYYIIVCKAWKPKNDEEASFIFSNDEEEIFFKHSDHSFSYIMANKSDTGVAGKWQSQDVELVAYRVVVLFQAAKFQGILSEITNFVQS